MSTVEGSQFQWRRILVSVFLPALLYSTGTGAVVPLIPLVADHLGSSLAAAGFIGAIYSVGMVSATLPAASLVMALTERWAMAAAAAVAALGSTVAAFAVAPWMLAIGVALIGGSTAVFGIARSSFMATHVPLAYRARAMSGLSGTFRLGEFVGPFIAAGAITLAGTAQVTFWVHVVGCAIVIAVLAVVKDPEGTERRRSRGRRTGDADAPATPPREGVFTIMRSRHHVLLRLGVSSMLLIGMRSGRVILVPLIAVSIGLAPATTALVIGIAGAIDFALFYAGGQIMDRFGRIWVAVPAMLGIGVGFIALALTSQFDAGVIVFAAVVAFLGAANGIASGLSLTIGADLADRRNPAPFLAVWRFTNDIGAAGLPLIVAATAAVSVTLAAFSMGGLALLGAGLFARYIPRLLPDRRGRGSRGPSE